MLLGMIELACDMYVEAKSSLLALPSKNTVG